MKKIITILVLIGVLATAFSTVASAQRSVTIPYGTNVNALIPGAYLRPITQSEKSTMVAAKVTGVSSAVMGVTTLGLGFGGIAYRIEGNKIINDNSDWNGSGAKDLEVSKYFLYGAGATLGISAALGITSICLKSKMHGKTIVKTETGGFVVEF